MVKLFSLVLTREVQGYPVLSSVKAIIQEWAVTPVYLPSTASLAVLTMFPVFGVRSDLRLYPSGVTFGKRGFYSAHISVMPLRQLSFRAVPLPLLCQLREVICHEIYSFPLPLGPALIGSSVPGQAEMVVPELRSLSVLL